MSVRRLALLALLIVSAPAPGAPPDCDPDDGGLRLPEGFCALVVADGLGPARRLTVAPNGDLYVALASSHGGVAALRDVDGDGRMERSERFGEGSGAGIELRDDYLYYAPGALILRYRLAPGELAPHAAPERIVSGLPAQGARAARPFTLDGAYLYVSLGAFPGDCPPPARMGDRSADERCERLADQGGVWRFRADRRDQTLPADGKRYSTSARGGGADPGGGGARMYVVQHGGDALGEAADDLVFYTGRQFPARYRGGAFVAFRGARDGEPCARHACSVAFAPFADGEPTGDYEPFAEGLESALVISTSGDARFQPVGLALGPDGSLYICDSERGRIWRVLYRG